MILRTLVSAFWWRAFPLGPQTCRITSLAGAPLSPNFELWICGAGTREFLYLFGFRLRFNGTEDRTYEVSCKTWSFRAEGLKSQRNAISCGERRDKTLRAPDSGRGPCMQGIAIALHMHLLSWWIYLVWTSNSGPRRGWPFVDERVKRQLVINCAGKVCESRQSSAPEYIWWVDIPRCFRQNARWPGIQIIVADAGSTPP